MEQTKSSNTIDEILDKVNIVDVISKYIDVQKKGNNYVAVCPFHDDSSPSLNIAPDKRIFKCFSCGAGGNAIGFVQRFKSIPFVEALQEVALMAGIEIKNNKKQVKQYSDLQEKIIAINNDAMNYFYSMLFTKEGKIARDYLGKRNISLDEIRTFNIGYAKSKYELYDFLKNKRNYTNSEIEESKLFIKKGLSYVPYFYNRIIFPIRDINGKVVGFSGRVFNSDNGPKYLNTSENVVFKKSNIAFNFYNAENAIRINDRIIILEGYMDVIALNRVSFKNSVAIMGTSISDYHIKEFSKITSKFTLFLDGDEPGIQASIKNAKKLMSYAIDLKIVFNDSGLDPDELVNENKAELISSMIKEAGNISEFVFKYLETKIKNDNTINNIEKSSEILFEVLSLRDGKFSDEIVLNNFAKLIGLSYETIKLEFEKYTNKNKVNKNNIKPNDFENILAENYFEIDTDFQIQESLQEYYEPPVEYAKNKGIYVNNNEKKDIINNLFLSNGANSESKKIIFATQNIIDYFLENIIVEENLKSIIAIFPNDFVSLANKIIEIKKSFPNISRIEIIEKLKNDKKVWESYKIHEYLSKFINKNGNSKKRLSDSINTIELQKCEDDIKSAWKSIETTEKLKMSMMEKLSLSSNEDEISKIKEEILIIEESLSNFENEHSKLLEKRRKIKNGI